MKNEIILIAPIYDEIEPITSADNKKLSPIHKKENYALRMWLEENRFTPTSVDDNINAASLLLEREYETINESKGANSNDITLIAYAKQTGNTVVTFEKQTNKPKEKNRYKIPSICKEQGVECINFVQMLEKLKIRI